MTSFVPRQAMKSMASIFNQMLINKSMYKNNLTVEESDDLYDDADIPAICDDMFSASSSNFKQDDMYGMEGSLLKTTELNRGSTIEMLESWITAMRDVNMPFLLENTSQKIIKQHPLLKKS